MNLYCGICGRRLDLESDPLSVDCGGDCWGCIGEIEAHMGDEFAIGVLRKEFVSGHRKSWLPSPKISNNTEALSVEIYLETPLGEPWANEKFELMVYKELMFNRRKIYFDQLVETGSDGIFTVPLELRVRSKIFCQIGRGDNVWTCPVECK